MTDKKRKSFVGLFVVSAISLLLVMILLVSSGALFQQSFRFVCYFPSSLLGLLEGSPVSLYGVQVGKIVSVQIVTDATTLSYSIPVVVEINKKSMFAAEDFALFTQSDADNLMADYIKRGLRARLATLSMVTGSLYIELSFDKLKEGSPPLDPQKLPYYNDMMQIPTVASPITEALDSLASIPFDKIATETSTTLVEINKTLVSVRNIIEESDIPKLILAYTDLAENMNTQVQDFSQIRIDGENLLKNLTLTSQKVNKLLDNNTKDVETVIQSLTSLSKSSESFINELSLLFKEDSSMMLELAQTLEAIQAASTAIAQLATLLEINPDSLIFGK